MSSEKMGGESGQLTPPGPRPGAGLFPLPPLRAPCGVDLSECGVRARRRILHDANLCVKSLNWLAGPSTASSLDLLGSSPRLAALHLEVAARVCRQCFEHRSLVPPPLPKEAFLELLRGRGLYETEAAYATLAPYKGKLVSLPGSVKEAPSLESLLPDDARR